MPDSSDKDCGIWKPGDLVGAKRRYCVLGELGSGGMAVVYEAEDVVLNKHVALKALRLTAEEREDPVTLEEKKERFRLEVEAYKRVSNDFVVKILDADEDAGTGMPYVVQELLEGGTLEQRLEDGPLSISEAMSFLWQAACALEDIHAVNLVHRDIKPGNLFIKTRPDGSRDLVVIDFGIVRFLDPENYRKTTIIAGTGGYAAPEQCAGWDVTQRADIWALGQVAKDMLFGLVQPGQRRPEERDDVPHDAFQSWYARITDPRQENRYGSAKEAVSDLAALLGVPLRPSGVPLSDSPPNREDSPRARARSQWLVGGAALGAVAMVAAVVVWALGTDATSKPRTPATPPPPGSVQTQPALPGRPTEDRAEARDIESTMGASTNDQASDEPPSEAPLALHPSAASPAPAGSQQKTVGVPGATREASTDRHSEPTDDSPPSPDRRAGVASGKPSDIF